MILALLLVLQTAGAPLVYPSVLQTDAQLVYPATVFRVIDADTQVFDVRLGFDVSVRVTIRIEGIDTPERFTPEGKLATAAVTARFEDCPITVQPTGARTFARWVARVSACGEDLADWLREQGHEKRPK